MSQYRGKMFTRSTDRDEEDIVFTYEDNTVITNHLAEGSVRSRRFKIAEDMDDFEWFLKEMHFYEKTGDAPRW